MGKFINIVSIIFVWLCAILVALWFVIIPLYEYVCTFSIESEIRLYIRLFLLSFIVSTLGVLRLYNSIVGNTRFAIKLREAIIKFQRTTPSLERSIKLLVQTLLAVKKSNEANSDKLDKLSNSIKK